MTRPSRLAAAGDVIEDCDLADVRWRELPVPEVRLKGCVLADGDLAEAELGDASFVDCTFQRCSFASATLSGSLWQRCIAVRPEPGGRMPVRARSISTARGSRTAISRCAALRAPA